MTDLAEIRRCAERLQRTGLFFAMRTKDPYYVGTRTLLEPIDWERVIVEVMARTGWTLCEVDDPPSTPVLTLVEGDAE